MEEVDPLLLVSPQVFGETWLHPFVSTSEPAMALFQNLSLLHSPPEADAFRCHAFGLSFIESFLLSLASQPRNSPLFFFLNPLPRFFGPCIGAFCFFCFLFLNRRFCSGVAPPPTPPFLRFCGVRLCDPFFCAQSLPPCFLYTRLLFRWSVASSNFAWNFLDSLGFSFSSGFRRLIFFVGFGQFPPFPSRVSQPPCWSFGSGKLIISPFLLIFQGLGDCNGPPSPLKFSPPPPFSFFCSPGSSGGILTLLSFPFRWDFFDDWVFFNVCLPEQYILY